MSDKSVNELFNETKSKLNGYAMLFYFHLAVDRVKEKLQEVYDQHKQMCDKLRDEKMQEVEEAYQKYLSEQTEQNKQAEEKQAAEGGQSIFSMNMNDDDE